MVRYNNHNSRIPSSSLLSSSLLDLRVCVLRQNQQLQGGRFHTLTITHIPLDPDSLLEINGVRKSIVSSQLRRDRVDMISEAATFISTDNIRLSDNVKFEVYNRDEFVLSGTLEISGSKRWGMNCEAEVTAGCGFLKELSSLLPSVEVYVTGCFSGTPIILTKTLQLGFRKKNQSRGSALDSIPEYENGEPQKGSSSEVGEYGRYKEDYEGEYDDDMYMRREYADGEDGDMSWFNAGVRVGVGIGLGLCVGIGIGVGLLVRTYQSTSRNFRRRLI